MDSIEILDREIEKGIRRRFPEGMDEAHKIRLAHELPVIKDMGYADYHLVVKDFLEYGRLLGFVPKEKIVEAPLTIKELEEYILVNGWKNPGMRIGPGRGSAVGSLVCYLLGITNLDPLKYDLLFERFLNPERVSMPDIDSDISNMTRQKVVEYVQHKYGKDAVCGIMTTNAQAPKGAVRIGAKYYGLKVYGEGLTSLGDKIAKDIPKEPGTSFSSRIDTNTGKIDKEGDCTLIEYLNKKYDDNADALEVIRWATIMEGAFTAYGSHAAGVVISDNDDVSEYLPLRWNSSAGMFTTQCDMVQTEDNGLLKFDFLGLKTLDIITEAIMMIERNHGKIIDPLNINLEDAKVYKNIFSAGKTNSVFQFESNGMKNMLKRFKPTCFDDLIILVSMYRPGPLQYLDGVIDVKNGVKPMEFMCPQLEPILGKTYGAIVYQEQVMRICQELAGFTLGHADVVRRYMSKKKADKLANERTSFVDGCAVNGVDTKVADELFDQMMDFASYAFNKSHAAAYAYNAYITGWLKCYYPAEFFAAALNWTTPKKLSGLVYEAKACGVKVLAPDINVSGKEYEAVDGCVRFGLSSVKGVKENAGKILVERKKGSFKDLKDFTLRVNPNKTVAGNLISAGAFDSFSKNREAMKIMEAELKEAIPTLQKKESFIKSAELVLPMVESSSAQDIINTQQNAGFKVEIDEPTTVEKLSKRIENAKNALAVANKDIDLIRMHNVQEDKAKRMMVEKDLLGMYVTQHPMDFYPEASEVGAEMTDEVGEGNAVIYGVVTNLSLKARKSDGAQMAFFTLEDKAGSIECKCFPQSYKKSGGCIKEGAVIKCRGNCEITTNRYTDENGEEVEEEEIAFYINTATLVLRKKKSIIMPVSSYAAFHLGIEDDFRKKYEQPDGYILILYDEAMDEARELVYKVSENVLTLFTKAELI